MLKKILIILFFAASVWARHAVPLQEAFAAIQDDGQPCPPECVTDSMEIVTWYPSPYNEYEELRLYPISDSNSQCNSDTRGLMYYDSDDDKVKLCKGPAGLNNWQDLGGGDYWKSSTVSGGSNDIYYTQSGNVGIGVGEGDTIGAKLQVDASIDGKGMVIKSGYVFNNECSSGGTCTYNYTGNVQYFIVPKGVTQITVTVNGAQGGGSNGGLGGMAKATLNVAAGETLQVYVGGRGGYNSGGAGGEGGCGTYGRCYAGSGGGASGIRRNSNWIIVAGGGGGAGGDNGGYTGGSGGAGGGGNGSIGVGASPGFPGSGADSNQDGIHGNPGCCGGATAGADGNGGKGGAGGRGGDYADHAPQSDAGGGGGGGEGYYGGGGGGGGGGGRWNVESASGGGGGGGGSNYVTGADTSMQGGIRSGDGQVIIQGSLSVSSANVISEWQDISGNVLSVVNERGWIGINNAKPEYSLHVNGTAWVTSGSWTGSDLRWKKNIEPLPNDAIGKLIKLNTISYDYNNELFQGMHFPSGRQIGLIAQDVEKEFPELVLTDNSGYKAVAYDKLTAVLVEAMKEQQDQIKAQGERMRDQQKEIEILELKLKELDDRE